ncbi:MAG: bifunctional DNA-formamidopyrimidine glycosylase/DNA-(apurinic or apyrimidinic site) lyase [Candidatus Nanopelagicales bacterium]
MPELPEVEVVRQGLAEHTLGRRIVTAEARHPRTTRRQPGGAAEFAALLAGRRIVGTGRRGKFLWLVLDDPGLALAAHLGMSGQFRVGELSGGPHERARFELADDTGGDPLTLRFIDQRTFGWVAAEELAADRHGELVPSSVSGIARDALDPHLDIDWAVARYRRRHAAIKTLLLDQGIVAGIGNIYADEALWAARIHPRTPADQLSPARLRKLLACAAEVMTAALAAGGTSFDRLYVNVNGASGYFERGLAAYGRAGQPCRRCGRPLRREVIANRSSHFCAYCQRRGRL